MNHTTNWLKNGLLMILLAFLISMVFIGMNGKALAPKQAVFTYHVNEEIKQDPAYYLKGAIHHGHIKMNLPTVDSHTPADYPITARQSKRNYHFIIRILP